MKKYAKKNHNKENGIQEKSLVATMQSKDKHKEKKQQIRKTINEKKKRRYRC